MDIRTATPEDAAAISALIKSLMHFFTTDPGGAGTEAFVRVIEPEAITGSITSPEFRCHVARDGKDLLGVVAVRDNTHLNYLFVARHAQGRGLGRRLWEHARREARKAGNPGRFTVNSTVFAVPIYERFGFKASGPLTEKDGIAFVPMTLEGAK